MRIQETSVWRTANIELFLLEEADVSAAYVDWLNNREINRYLESRFMVHSIETTRDFVRGCLESDDRLLFGIRHMQSGGYHVGNIKLTLTRPHGLAEVGILIGEKSVQGRGVATEAICVVAKIAREELRLRKLTAGCYASNTASERAFFKAGFTKEGERPVHLLLDGKPEALVLFGRVL